MCLLIFLETSNFGAVIRLNVQLYETGLKHFCMPKEVTNTMEYWVIYNNS